MTDQQENLEKLICIYPPEIRETVYTALGPVVTAHQLDVIEVPATPADAQPKIVIHNPNLRFNEERVTWARNEAANTNTGIITKANLSTFAQERIPDNADTLVTRVWRALVRRHPPIGGHAGQEPGNCSIAKYLYTDEDDNLLGIRADHLRLLVTALENERLTINGLHAASISLLRNYLLALFEASE